MALQAPRRLRIADEDERRVVVAWDAGDWDGRAADEYELKYDGARAHYGPHRGTWDQIDTTEYRFPGRAGFTYRLQVRARLGDEWTPWSEELTGVGTPVSGSGDAGRITSLRVHREIGFGPPHDHLLAHAVFQVDDVPDRYFGFPIPFDGADGAGHRVDAAWLGTLRAALASNRGIIVASEFTNALNALVSDIRTIPGPERPSTPWVHSQDGRRVQLRWSHDNTGYRGEAVTYDVRYKGKRTLRKSDSGIRTGLTSPEFAFTGKGGYRYCFRVRARNVSGVSGWSEETCAERLTKEPVQETLTVQGRLEPDTPHDGNALYSARFAPTGRDPELVSIEVPGSDLDRWGAHFLPPGTDRSRCTDTDIGAVVWPGSALQGDGMRAVYGVAEPTPPLWIVACKVSRGDRNADPIPVRITYRRWLD